MFYAANCQDSFLKGTRGVVEVVAVWISRLDAEGLLEFTLLL